MNYELAKQLKDAGFIQNPHEHSESPNAWFDVDGNLGDWKNDENDVYNPTLSELIESCGDRFSFLRRVRTDYWEAIKINPIPEFPQYPFGSTPEEAVANLYLELNKS